MTSGNRSAMERETAAGRTIEGTVMDERSSEMTITLPGDVELFRSVRLAVGGLAAHVGFDVAAIDDLRIGVDELCAALAEVGDGGPIVLSIAITPGSGLRIAGRTARAAQRPDGDRLAFSRQILAVVADDHSLDDHNDEVCFWLERRVEQTDDESP